MRFLPQSLLNATLTAAALMMAVGTVSAQQHGYSPIDLRTPGMAGRWSATTKPGIDQCPQPVRVELPGGGLVTFFSGSANIGASPAPAQVSLIVGPVYRIQISDMPDFPGAELYPTIELVDRLHPPDGRAHEFPIPIAITAEEIEIALQDRLVTKVIYLEQPEHASPQEPGEPRHITELPACTNLLQAAGQRGRPMAILRLGGRVPDKRSVEPGFFGDYAPVLTGPTTSTLRSPAPVSQARIPEDAAVGVWEQAAPR